LARQSGRELLESGDWSHDSAAEAGDRLAEALGVRVQGVRTLTSNLRADLDEDTSAIPWWGDQGGGLERLIADHLVHAAGDLSGLILEARIHLMDLIDTWARQEASWQRRLQEDRAAPPYGGPRTLEDDLDDVRDDMHLAGIFRALAQVMDCLAVVVIGVLDLPVDIHRASWTQIDQALTKVQDQADGRAPVALQLQQELVAAGPAGWLTWVLESRHMQLHRPRLMSVLQPKVLGVGLDLPGHAPAERIRLVHHLPSAPKVSFIECFVVADGPQGSYLTEDGQLTLEHALRSVVSTVSVFVDVLDAWWSARRTDPNHQVQENTAKQWARRPGPADRFAGYAPGSTGFDGVSTMVINTGVGERLSAAAVGDDRRGSVWTGKTWPKP
jgi:hypothetical protein